MYVNLSLFIYIYIYIYFFCFASGGARCICDRCCAVKPFKNAPKPLNFGDFGKDAIWKGTLFSMSTYFAMTPPGEVSPWATYMSGWCLDLNLDDLMHNVHLGIAKDLLASIIIQMLEEGLLGPGAPDVVLKALTATGR